MIALLLFGALTLPSTQAPAQPQMQRCLGGQYVPPGMQCPSVCPWIVFFDQGGASLTADARATLDQVAARLTTYPSGVRLAGHSDASENPALSQARGEAIRDYLAAKGLRAASISVESWGNQRPAVETPPGQPEAQNRSVYIDITD